MTSLADGATNNITFTVFTPGWLPRMTVTLTVESNFGDQKSSEMDLNHLTNTAEVVHEALVAHFGRMHSVSASAESK